MKKCLACMLALLLAFGGAVALGENTLPGKDGWNIPEENGMTEEVLGLFNSAMEKLMGVNYEPVAFLGEKDGVYCILCRSAAVVPNPETYYTLVYVTESGIQNIWEIWMDQHAEKQTEQPEEQPEEQSEAAEPAETSESADVQYVLYLGTNDKDTVEPVFSEEEAMAKAQEILIRHFGGYTIQEARGGWVDDGKVYREYTLVIYLSDTTPEAVHAAADEMIETFRQSSVLIQENPTKTEFYSGN